MGILEKEIIISNLVKVVGVVVAVIVLLVGLFYLSGAISIFTAPFRGEVDKNEKVEADGDYRIAAYDEFYKLCSSVQSKNDQINILQLEMNTTTDETRKAQLQSAITAQQNTKAELVNEYNSKAAGEYTKGQFRDSDLPYEIDVNDEEVECNTVS